MSSNEHLAWAETFLAALASAGVRDVVVCPGSRSTPLALAADVTAGLHVHTAVDERAAAFFALGQARVTRLRASCSAPRVRPARTSCLP
jgi:2-succinyl-5-enolpyruvyl-6-hydroxy-3-cyclohexene-1-carboxylate synthase